jgi:hypothetical protein
MLLPLMINVFQFFYSEMMHFLELEYTSILRDTPKTKR